MKPKSNMIRMLVLTFKLSKKFYIFSILRALVLSSKAVIGVYGLAIIIDQLSKGDANKALLYAGYIVLGQALLLFLEISLSTYTEIENDRVQNDVTVLIAEKLMKVEYKYLEDPTYLDTSEKAKSAIEDFDALNIVMKSTVNLLTYLVTVASLITLIVLFNPVIVLIILVSVILHFMASRKANNKQTVMTQEFGPINRKNRYYSGVINDMKYQKDFRMYPLRKMIFDQFYQFVDQSKIMYKKYFNYMGNFQILYIGINYVQILLIYSFVAYISIINLLGVGAYLLLTASAMKASSTIDSFTNSFIEIKRNIILLQPIFDILDMDDSITLSDQGYQCEKLETLEFKDVSFAYPGTEHLILNKVSFIIKKGEKISIVGFNGAGKTTIVKLLSRFYKPNHGCILWNGIDIHEYNYNSYISQISAVFQDFKLFAYSISQNVDLTESNKDTILQSLHKVGLQKKLTELPYGMDSLLSKEFSEDGIDLSGGEKQKIAIARAMIQDSSLTILDEPTSALDPISEADIYENFNELVKDKTSIYISHRMSSSRFVDRIIVLDQGEIIANDSHEHLVKYKDSIYYKMWTAQAEFYS